MCIICFEGPSAVGKTTTANALKADYGAFIVPEVNELFDKPRDAPADWYLERQVERWAIALEQNRSNRLVVLDGDPFQPLWYGWTYGYEGQQNLDFMEQFYQSRILDKTIAFPDLYIIFGTSEDELRKRRESDLSRQRRGFEKHLGMIEPQQRYFYTMSSYSPGRVCSLEAETIQTNIRFVQKSVFRMNNRAEDESMGLCQNMIQWMKEHKA